MSVGKTNNQLVPEYIFWGGQKRKHVVKCLRSTNHLIISDKSPLSFRKCLFKYRKTLSVAAIQCTTMTHFVDHVIHKTGISGVVVNPSLSALCL